MKDLESAMNRAVQTFVAEVTALTRRAAHESLDAAFTGYTAMPGNKGRPRGRTGAKRSPSDLDALASRFVAHVKAHPGLRIEQINKQLGTTTDALALPIRKLIASGAIATKGQKRSTTYFVGKKS
jgi:hypothetical protein